MAPMSLRHDLTFQYTGIEILSAVRRKLDYHHERFEHWTAEQQAAIEEIRASGIEVTALEVTGGVRAQVNIDQALQTKLNLAESKIKSHKRAVDDYALWENALSNERNNGRSFELDPDDIKFFGL